MVVILISRLGFTVSMFELCPSVRHTCIQHAYIVLYSHTSSVVLILITILTDSIGVPCLYFALVILFRQLNMWTFTTWKGSRASDIMAFEIVAGLCVAYLGIAGFIAYFSLFSVDIYGTLEVDRFYAKSTYIENYLIYPMVLPILSKLRIIIVTATFLQRSFIFK